MATHSSPAKVDSGVRVYTVDVLAYQIVLFFGFLILVYAAFNPVVFSGDTIVYAIGSILIFVAYPAVKIFKLSGKKIVVGDDYIAWIDKDGEDSRVKFVDITRIIYSSDQMGANSVNLHCYATSTSMDIKFQNFSKNDENLVRDAILSKCPSDVVVAYLQLYKSISSTVSYSFTGSDSMNPNLRESIREQLKSIENAPLAEGLVAIRQFESEILASRKGEVNELTMQRKTRQFE